MIDHVRFDVSALMIQSYNIDRSEMPSVDNWSSVWLKTQSLEGFSASLTCALQTARLVVKDRNTSPGSLAS